VLASAFGVATTPALAGLVEVNDMRREDSAVTGIKESGVVVGESDAGTFILNPRNYEVGVTPRPNELVSEESRSDSEEGPDFDNREKFVGIGAGDVFYFDPGNGSDRPAAKAVPLPPAIWTGLPMLGAVIARQLARRRKRRVT
jgi:hypothetical protein